MNNDKSLDGFLDHIAEGAHRDALDPEPETEALLYNLSETDYHALGYASASRLNLLSRSPAHLRYALDNPIKPTKAMAVGSAVHAAILEPDRFGKEWASLPEGHGSSKEVKAAKTDLIDAGFSVDRMLKPSEYAVITGMRDSVMAHPIAKDILKSCQTEVSALWRDPASDVQCKSRIDALPVRDTFWDRAVVDIKTTTNASSDEFARSAYTFGYFRQAALYLNGINYLESFPDDALDEGMRVSAQARTRFIFICVEKTAPYCVNVCELDAEALARGQASVRRLLQAWSYCQQNDEWGAYGNDQINTISLPHWAV